MLWGFAIQVVVMAVSLGVSMPQLMAGFYCQAADLPVEMVLYRCAFLLVHQQTRFLSDINSTASIVYESFLFGLMMIGVIRGDKEGFSDTALLTVLVRDGAIAFIGVFCTYASTSWMIWFVGSDY